MKRILVVILTLSILFLAGCSHTSNHPEPPYAINSLEEFHSELDSAKSGETTSTFTALLNLGYPKIIEEEKVEDFSLTYYSDGSMYNIYYWIAGVQYGAYYSRYDSKIDRSNMDIVMVCNIDGITVNLYQGANCLVGEFYKDDYQIMITVRGYEDPDDIDFSHFTWSTALNLD